MVAGVALAGRQLADKPPLTEQEKYEKMWEFPEYRNVAPGEELALTFLKQARPSKDAECIDFGCGTGRGSMMLALIGAMKVTMVDFAANCLDLEVKQTTITQPERMKFLQADLTKTLPINAPYGYCTDVMEHIPPQDVETVLRNILGSAEHCFFNIACFQDSHGALIQEQLHLTVREPIWWVGQITKAGGVIHWSQETVDVHGNRGISVYCSAWKDAAELVKVGKVNTEESVLDQQIAENIRAGWKNVHPWDRQNRELVLLAGGPSMNAQVEEIGKLRREGAALVTCNGAYGWAIERKFSISAQIVLDARPFNARFTRPVLDKCKYLIASQVHPSTLEGLPKERTEIWHAGLSEANEKLAYETAGHFYPVPGGCTVVLRAIPLLRMLGFWRIHIFGFDSCVLPDGTHHAYAQEENDREPLFSVTCGGRMFECTPWMLSQASEFRDLVKMLGDEVELAIYGEGLIAQIISTGAGVAKVEAEKNNA